MTDVALLDDPDAIVGASGAGKSYTARKKVEQLLGAGRHTIIFDPTGVWYGLRSDAAGTGTGFDLPIFGGDHGDVPIGAGQGGQLAALLLDQRISAIVDLSRFDAADLRRFALDFLTPLRKRERENLHLVFDEADEFAPQTAPDDVGYQLVEQMKWIAKRGRVYGLVPTFITQRPADFAKAVLSQVQTLYFHQLIAPADQAPVKSYLQAKADKATVQTVMGSLPELGRGERWIYSPRRKVLERGVTATIETFDTMAAPSPGESRREPGTLKTLDVSRIRDALRAIVDGADLQRVGDDSGAALATAVLERDHQIEALRRELAVARGKIDVAEADIRRFRRRAAEAFQSLAKLFPNREGLDLHPSDANLHDDLPAVAPEAAGERATGEDAATAPSPVARKDSDAVRGRKALEALARIHPAGLTETQWALFAGYARKGGTWSTYKNALRGAGLVAEAQGRWTATAAGLAAAGVAPAPLPSAGPGLARFWGSRISGVSRMVDVLVNRWPHFTTREGLAADLGMAAGGGTFGTYLGRLRTNELLDEQGKKVRLSAAVMGPAK